MGFHFLLLDEHLKHPLQKSYVLSFVKHRRVCQLEAHPLMAEIRNKEIYKEMDILRVAPEGVLNSVYYH